MQFFTQIPLRNLIEFCRVLRHNLAAGLTLRRVFRQQAERGPYSVRPVAQRISEKLEQGESLEAALKDEKHKFPPIFLSLTAMGEESGNLPEVLAELEEYFTTLDFSLGERQLEGVREFARQVGDQIGVLDVPEVMLLPQQV